MQRFKQGMELLDIEVDDVEDDISLKHDYGSKEKNDMVYLID